MREIVAEVKNLKAGYGNRVILENINFQVFKGEIFMILGGSGCGKSTLLKHMIGLYKPMSGDVIINGKSIVNTDGAGKREIMRSFGVTYQGGALFKSLTLTENISLPLEEYTGYPKDVIEKIAERKLELVGLDGFGDYMPSEISGGMAKRAGIARAMALDPELLFFDEPSAGLDPISSAKLDELILNLRNKTGTTMLIVTHELDSIFAVADRVIVLDRESKGIIASGKPAERLHESPNPFVREFLSRSDMKRKV